MINFNFNGSGGVKVIFAEQTDQTEIIKWAKKATSFKAKAEDIIYLPSIDNTSYILIGLGEKDEIKIDSLRTIGFKLFQKAKQNNVTEIEVELPYLENLEINSPIDAFVEGLWQGTYQFDKYKAKKENNSNQENFNLKINFSLAPEYDISETDFNSRTTKIAEIMSGVFLARDLVNETANYLTPTKLAEAAVNNLEPLGIEVTIYEREKISEIGMSAFLAVAQGSDQEPRFIIMEYKGNPHSKKSIGLVGKGMTYDTGGYSIKPTSGMLSMHCDMGGAGSVIGTMYALAKTKAKTNVIAVIAACENMISGRSFKPGDIINSLSGKTIEIDNTDAEGRVTLADAIYFITNNLNVEKVIDLATLTGACLVALGEEYTGALTNDEDFYNEFNDAAQAVGEKVWLLPNDKKLAKNNESKVADIKNSGGRLAGTITAGQFVEEFIADEKPWIHLDIAGTAYLSKPNDYLPERATGVHVKALTKLLS